MTKLRKRLTTQFGVLNKAEPPTAFAKATASLAVARLRRAEAEGREVQVAGVGPRDG